MNVALAAYTGEFAAGEGVSLDDFFAFMPTHSYIFTATGEMWPAASVNSRIKPIAVAGKLVKASEWLDQNRPVEQMTWAPGLAKVVDDRLIADGGWIERKGVRCFNLYRPPIIAYGDADAAGVWVDHVVKVFGPEDARHVITWLAHRVQRPYDKLNHALVLGGGQGIGKDTLLEPVKRAVGSWNFAEVSPKHMLGRFNGFAKSVILRVSEARDLGDIDRFAFYDHMKTYTASPPDVLRVDEKNLREYSVLNCCGVIITTNHKGDGIYLPPDDRRHFVAWSDLTKDDFPVDYWPKLWKWYDDGGDRNVAAYLRQLDISTFDPKAPPPKTTGFWDIVDAGRAPEDAELADVFDRMNQPDVVTIEQIATHAEAELGIWLRDRKTRRQVPHRLEACGYVSVRNEHAKDGLWKIRDRRQAVYAKKTMQIRDRLSAANRLAGDCGF